MAMKKIFAAIMLCAALVFSSAAPVLADPPPAPSLEDRIAELEATIAGLMAAMNAPQFVDHGAIERQRRENVQAERFMFHMMYYGIVLSNSHISLLRAHHKLMERQFELEEFKYELGLSTQNTLDEMELALADLARQIETLTASTTAQRRQVETRRDRDGYDFIGNFRIPTPARRATPRDVRELQENLLRYSGALATLNSHINQASRHGAHWNEIRLMEEQRDMLRRQLELAALATWNNYTAARAEFNATVAMRSLLETRSTMIDNLLEFGEISATDHKAMRFGIYAEQIAADMAAVALSMAIAEVNYMMRGIIGG
jgi:hypothetical protein